MLLVAHLQFAQASRTTDTVKQNGQTKRKITVAGNISLGVMAGKVLRMNISAIKQPLRQAVSRYAPF